MLGVNVIYTMKPGMREQFLKEIAQSGAQEAVRKENGCIQYDYYRSVDDPDRLLLLEKWTDREAQKIHMTQPHMVTMAEIKDRCATDNPVLEFYDF